MDLVRSISIDNLLNQRLAIRERLSRVQQDLADIEGLLQSAGLGPMSYLLDGNNYQRANVLTHHMATIQTRLDAMCWDHLLQESGLRTFMDASARADWKASIEGLKVPVFNRDIINGTFQQLYQARGEMFERGVLACFERLSWDYQTNQPAKFGKRIVVTHLMAWRGCHPSSRTASEIDDLLRVLHVLDDQPEPDHRQGVYARILEQVLHGEGTAIE